MTNNDNEQIQKAREALKEFLEKHKIPQTTVARGIDYSPTAINQFLQGSYPSPATLPKIAERIIDYIQNYQKTAEGVSECNQDGDLKFAATNAAKRVFKVADFALTAKTIGLVTGVPGYGRTMACKEFKKKKPTSILIEVPPHISPKSIVRQICAELKQPLVYYKKSTQINYGLESLFETIINEMKGANRLIIIDEAENLNVPCLEVIRRIQDFTGVGILLSGSYKLVTRLMGQRQELQQLYSRVGCHVEIDKLQIEDVKEILKVNFPEGIRFAGIFLSLSKNNGRWLKHLIKLVRKTVRDTESEISEDMIDAAARELLAPTRAL